MFCILMLSSSSTSRSSLSLLAYVPPQHTSSYLLAAPTNHSQYTHASASVTFGKIKRKLKAKAAGSSASPSTPKKSAAAGATPKAKTPRTGKRATIDDAAAGTPTKKGKKAVQAADSDEDGDEMGKFLIKKEEAADVNASADAFFEEATAYAHGEV